MTRSKSIKIDDPFIYFSKWHYKIEKHHFETLGVTLREFIKNKIPYNSYSIQSPPEFQFAQGHIFYKASDPNQFLQIAFESDLFRVEVHCGKLNCPASQTLGYSVNFIDFSTWLQTGEIPKSHEKVDRASSKSGLLAWQLPL